MKCFIGLGNPGDQYNNTKHNFGYWIIDSYLKKNNLQLKLGKGDFVFSKTEKNVVGKTTTFMNNSGLAVKHILNYFDTIKIENMIVVYDDLDLDLGTIRFKPKGSDGGHNGLKSIIYHLNNNVFTRLKIGIATSLKMRPSEAYVLKPFPKKFHKEIDEIIDNAICGINFYFESNNNIELTMNEFN